MAEHKVRVDTGPTREPLWNRPFAALSGATTFEAGVSQEPAEPEAGPEPITRPFSVGRTRKGRYGLSLQKRPNGKQVTVLANVEGDAEALLKLLKNRCGAGGVVRGSQLELQGDHRVAVEAFLKTALMPGRANQNVKS